VALIRTDVSEDRIASIFRVMPLFGYDLTTAKRYVIDDYHLPEVLIRATRRHLPEDDNHHSHRRGNLKSYRYVIHFCY
jgi:hypothetical protein